MGNKYRLLLKMQLYDFWGINRRLHAHSRKEKRQNAVVGMLALIVLAGMLASSALFSLGMAGMGAAGVLPAVCTLVCSMVTLVLTFLKSSGVLLGLRDDDMVFSLPVKSIEVVLSRMTRVYLSNLSVSVIVGLPAVVVFGSKAGRGTAAALIFLLSLPFIPILPMTLSLGAGILITAISSRSKHRNGLSLALSTLAVLLAVAASTQVRDIAPAEILNMGLVLSNAARRIYPPAALVAAAVREQNWLYFFAFAGLSAFVGGAFAAAAARFCPMRNTAVFGHPVARCAQRPLKASSPVRAMYIRELERYFSCTIYALNSTLGMVLLLVLSALLLFVSPEELERQSRVAGLGQMLRQILPMVVAVFVSMTSTTAASLSLEGKSRWLMCSVPVRAIDIFNAKIAVNLTVIAPFALASILLLSIRMKVSPPQAVLLCAVPAAYACFISVLGMYMNVKFPKYDWTSEYYAVKGGAVSVLATMGLGMLSSLAPLFACMAFPAVSGIVMAAAPAVLLSITVVLYGKLRRCRLYETVPCCLPEGNHK